MNEHSIVLYSLGGIEAGLSLNLMGCLYCRIVACAYLGSGTGRSTATHYISYLYTGAPIHSWGASSPLVAFFCLFPVPFQDSLSPITHVKLVYQKAAVGGWRCKHRTWACLDDPPTPVEQKNKQNKKTMQ